TQPGRTGARWPPPARRPRRCLAVLPDFCQPKKDVGRPCPSLVWEGPRRLARASGCTPFARHLCIFVAIYVNPCSGGSPARGCADLAEASSWRTTGNDIRLIILHRTGRDRDLLCQQTIGQRRQKLGVRRQRPERVPGREPAYDLRPLEGHLLDLA